MTKTQFKKKITSMKKDISHYIDDESQRLFDSGGVDPISYDNNFLLPKIILTVVFKNLSWQYKPFTKEAQDAVNNLCNF